MKKSGFTLIEILVSISILSLVSVVIASILFLSLRSDSKTRSAKEVKQNGNAAVLVLKEFIRNAESISCFEDQIDVVSSDGGTSSFLCFEGKISSNSANLTSSLVECSNFSVSCSDVTGGQLVEFSFTLSPSTTQLGDSSLEFSDKVYFRQQ